MQSLEHQPLQRRARSRLEQWVRLLLQQWVPLQWPQRWIWLPLRPEEEVVSGGAAVLSTLPMFEQTASAAVLQQNRRPIVLSDDTGPCPQKLVSKHSKSEARYLVQTRNPHQEYIQGQAMCKRTSPQSSLISQRTQHCSIDADLPLGSSVLLRHQTSRNLP